MLFSRLAHYFDLIEHEPSRLGMTRHLAKLFEELSTDHDEFCKTMYLLQGRVAPQYVALEFGMATKLVARAAASSMNMDLRDFQNELDKRGDIGKTVEHYKSQFVSFEQEDLEVVAVFDRLHRLATESGDGSVERKASLLSHLISQLDSLSCRYLVRIPAGQMRLGFSDMTVLDAFSWFLGGDKTKRAAIEAAFHVRPDLGYIGQVIKEKGVEGMAQVHPVVGTPILMMRAERLSSGVEIIDKIGTCSVEPKYDGFRVQVHVKKGDGKESESVIQLFSRNLEDMTPMYPDIVAGVRDQITATHEAIFEGEAIGYDPKTNALLPFQETVQRKRKYDIAEKAAAIPLRLFVFDALYIDGKSYINEPFTTRREAVKALFKGTSDKTIQVAKDEVTDDPSRVEEIFDRALADGLEGILVKKLDGIYQAGARGWNWIKLKRSYSSKVDDTIDCVVMGYDYGQGKRTGFGIGAFLAGVYDAEQDQFVTVSKIGTGLTDDEWREMKERCDALVASNKPALYDVDHQMECSVWVNPGIVVEIKADEITRSSMHTAGRSMKASKSGNASHVDESGYALRFPRLVRFRDDRAATDATTLTEVIALYTAQKI